MKKSLLLALVLIPVAASADDIHLTLNRVLRNVTVTRIDQDGVVVTPNLPGATGIKYPWNMIAPEDAKNLQTQGTQQRAATEQLETMERAGLNCTCTVISVCDDGVIAEIISSGDSGSATVFIYTTQKYVDDEKFSARLFPAGRYQYVSAMGAQKTIIALTTSAQDSLRRKIAEKAANQGATIK